ncbi:hypothetical protein [Arthrobacter woluwensis]|uniref:hypothetical protein n=1 Tax=Arthrobacter woluwensis TaxID=156980 RepID=UPI00381E05CF
MELKIVHAGEVPSQQPLPTPPVSHTFGMYEIPKGGAMLLIRMGEERPVSVDDPLGRSHIGWVEGLTQQECWERSRGVWILNETRVLEQDLCVIVDPDWTVRAVARITGVSKAGEKRAVEGTLLQDHELVGTDVEANTSRNSISYR